MPTSALFDQALTVTKYQNIAFPAMQIGSHGGHDSVKHTALNVRGADIESTGLQPYSFHLRIPMIEGLDGGGLWNPALFTVVYHELIKEFEVSPFGQLLHPTRGKMLAHVDSWTEEMNANIRNGILLDVSFTEQVGSSEQNLLFGLDQQSPADALVTHAAAADAIAPAGAPSLLAKINAILSIIEKAEGAYRDTQMAITAFRSVVTTGHGYADLSGLGCHEYRFLLNRIQSDAFRMQDDLLGIKQPRRYTVQRTASLACIAALPQVYGDPSMARALSLANNIPNPLFVPAGTVLLVP